MTDHPITPPPELRQQWREQAPRYRDGGVGREEWLMERAAQWGADQELEATLAEVSFLAYRALADRVRAARRPKPPSLKEEAMQEFDCLMSELVGTERYKDRISTVRRALEAIPDD